MSNKSSNGDGRNWLSNYYHNYWKNYDQLPDSANTFTYYFPYDSGEMHDTKTIVTHTVTVNLDDNTAAAVEKARLLCQAPEEARFYIEGIEPEPNKILLPKMPLTVRFEWSVELD